MQTEQLDYYLPPELIAQAPANRRSESQLLVLDRRTGRANDRTFSAFVDYVNPGDCLVLNDTKVVPARFFIRRHTGARMEALFMDADDSGMWRVLIKNSRKLKPGEQIMLLARDSACWGSAEAVEPIAGGGWTLRLAGSSNDAFDILGEIGLPPLPPYIKRDQSPRPDDLTRYQTVYARQPGAIAAPTAGLHFTEEILKQLEAKGLRLANVTLHVGTGTFKPVKTQRLEDHKMHSERYQVLEEDATTINDTIRSGGRVIAVGTTSVRTLETVAEGKHVRPATGQTALFITPGYRFQAVDAMLTNFHLPKSTLLALVAAFAGLDNIMAAYRHAIDQQYRFYSYGDAMLII